MTKGSGGRRYGVVSGDQQRAMSGLDFVQGLVTGTLPLNSMAETLGYDIVEVSPGRVAIAAEPTAAHLNPAGTVHGGLSATLLDSCMGLAVHSTLDKGFGQTHSSSRFRSYERLRRKPGQSELKVMSSSVDGASVLPKVG
jgi:acyl-coenzyme A thioesterase PaaI-like protein